MKKILILTIFSTISCGLKTYPPEKGTFCDLVHRPIECIEVDYRGGRIVYLDKRTYPLLMENVVNYHFPGPSNQTYRAEVLHEDRVQIVKPDGSKRFYLRKKEKGQSAFSKLKKALSNDPEK